MAVVQTCKTPLKRNISKLECIALINGEEMKKTVRLAVTAALALGATSALATNGSALIGMGAKSRGMAGIGIGMSHGAESALENPALITTVKGTEISFGGTIFMPNVKNENDDSYAMGSKGSANSDANLNLIPEVSLASKVSDHFYIGVGMWGTGGMGVDYRSKNTGTAQMSMFTNLQLMQFGVPLAYKTHNFSIAVTPLIQYGSLNINYTLPPYYGSKNIGFGTSQDYKWGYNVGLAYEVAGLTLGASYTSQIDMNYKGVLSTAVSGMSPGYTNDKLSTPATYGIGASYKFGGSTIAVDYKKIKWSDAKGYKDFDWKDQDVIIVGYQYDARSWAARIGYNYAKSPIKEQALSSVNSAGLSGGLVNTFNELGFPGIVQSHVAIGGTYKFSKTTSFDVAYTYAPQVTDTYKNFVGADITTKHSQNGISLQVNYDF
jgi:long-chain fatty acid transport protein